MTIVHFPRQFRLYTDHHKKHLIDGSCVRDVIQNLVNQFPELIGPVFSQDLHPLPFVGLFLDGQPVVSEQDLRLSVNSNANLILINAVAGG